MFTEIERKYGTPRELNMSFLMNLKEFDMLKASTKDGRNSDVTIFIFKEDIVVVIAMPWYPKGLYRAPSGGIKPDEDIAHTANREAYEETGAKIKLLKYLLRIQVMFVCNQEKIEWNSHVFTARYVSGKLQPIDTKEIKEVALMSLEELSSLKPRLLAQDSGGLAYHAALTEVAIAEILSAKQTRGL